jgi:hypothetical protein
MKILQRMVESIRFFAKIRYKKVFVNPEIREVIEDYNLRKQDKVKKKLEIEEKNIDLLKETYEYKCYEHFHKIDYLKTKEKSEDFLHRCKFDFLTDKKMLTKGKFFYPKYFISPEDYKWTKLKKLFILVASLVLFKLGLINGKKDSLLYDEVKENVLDIRTEDQLLSILIHKKMPILVLYYYPGDYYSFEMQNAQGAFVEEHGEDYAVMAKVNCKYNLDLCLKKNQYLKFPQWELMYPPFSESDENGNEIKKYPVIPCNYNRSIEGIEGFLAEQGLIPDKYNPVFLLSKAMNRYEI